MLKGELLRSLPEANDGAEHWFERGFDAAGELDARMPQLRAAIGLCRTRQARGDEERCADQLSAVHATFTEGFATPDLIEAADLLGTARG